MIVVIEDTCSFIVQVSRVHSFHAHIDKLSQVYSKQILYLLVFNGPFVILLTQGVQGLLRYGMHSIVFMGI